MKKEAEKIFFQHFLRNYTPQSLANIFRIFSYERKPYLFRLRMTVTISRFKNRLPPTHRCTHTYRKSTRFVRSNFDKPGEKGYKLLRKLAIGNTVPVRRCYIYVFGGKMISYHAMTRALTVDNSNCSHGNGALRSIVFQLIDKKTSNNWLKFVR